jgi:2,5-diamino-6-(ribosylamino)-4(3H)-pyrimidinone 5'-phosphate reductase
MSADGKIALRSRRQTQISDDDDKRRVHELRNSVDAILVGVETVISDDPKLTVNEKYVKNPKHPIRIVLDSDGRVPSKSLVFNGVSKTIIVTNDECEKEFANADVIRCGQDQVDLERLMAVLEERGIRTMLVEGGSSVIWSFLKKRLADEMHIFIGSIVIGGEKAPTPAGGDGAGQEREIVQLKLIEAEAFGSGVLLKYEVVK